MQLGSRYREKQLAEVLANGNVASPVPTPLGIYREYTNNVKTFELNLNNTGITPTPRVIKTWDRKNPGPPYESGGPFSSIRILYPQATPQGGGVYYRTVGNKRYEYTGSFYLPDCTHDPIPLGTLFNLGWNAGQNTTGLPPDPEAVYGPSAFSKTRPPLSDGGLGQAIVEVRDAPRMLKTSARGFKDFYESIGGRPDGPVMAPKKAADHFINGQFGWRPFLKDIDDLADNLINYRDKFRRLMDGNGKYQKRERTLFKATVDEGMLYSQSGYFGCQPSGTYLNNIFPSSNFSVWTGRVDRVWSEGAFTYYRPEFDVSDPDFYGPWSRLRRHMDIHGMRINPSLLWKVTPWSWLADWFLPINRYIEDMEAVINDGVVAKYLYVMQSVTKNITSVHQLFGADSGPVTLMWNRSYTTKTRVGANNPYGFGQSWDGLSPKQLLILGALGITRV